MEITKALCESILGTLPIGYYAGRRINITMDDKAETSFYSPMEDSIVISYPVIAERMKKAPDTINPENAVRSMLYHEVSHAILTPVRMPARDYMNIMEDERIESVLRNYYHGVDFKQQLYDLCGNTPSKAVNPIQAFFNAVRFGFAPQDILEEVNRIIRRYKDLHRNSGDKYYPYYSETTSLYEKIARRFRSNPEAFQPPKGGSSSEQLQLDQLKEGSSQNGEGKGESSGQKNGQENSSSSSSSSEQGKNGAKEESDINNNSKCEDGCGGHGEYKENNTVGDDERNVKMSKEELKKIFEKAFDESQKLPEEYRQQLEDFRKTAEMIIGNFNKKNKGGSGVNAYSGVFNPRAVARQDYRFFERSMSTQGNNRFGTCHLNLFIDCSGSFWASEQLVNGILMVLSDIESKNRNFSLDVSFINHNYYDCTSVRERNFHATGGNDIPKDMKERFLKRQLPNTCNYNIVLFDGDAFSDCGAGKDECIRRFSAFDYKQTTLITDDDNERYLGKGFNSAKVVVTNNYTDELIRHITKALTVAFG